jgi:hypothetical protein
MSRGGLIAFLDGGTNEVAGLIHGFLGGLEGRIEERLLERGESGLGRKLTSRI